MTPLAPGTKVKVTEPSNVDRDVPKWPGKYEVIRYMPKLDKYVLAGADSRGDHKIRISPEFVEEIESTNEALKNYELSDISYDKGANLATATFTSDLTSNDKSSLKEIIVDTFGVKPGWVGHNGLTLNIPEKQFNDFQKLMILDLQMKLAGEETVDEAKEGKVNRNSFVPIGVMIKDFKESWNSKEMNREAKLVPGGEWVDINTGGDSEMMMCLTPEMQKALPKDQSSMFVMTVGDLMWDADKKDFVTILINNNGDEQAVWLQKGKGEAEIEKFMDANESIAAPVMESFSSVIKNMIVEGEEPYRITLDKVKQKLADTGFKAPLIKRDGRVYVVKDKTMIRGLIDALDNTNLDYHIVRDGEFEVTGERANEGLESQSDLEAKWAKEAQDAVDWKGKFEDDFVITDDEFEGDGSEGSAKTVWSVYDRKSNEWVGLGGDTEEEALAALKKKLSEVNEAVDNNDTELEEGDSVTITGHVDKEGKKGTVVEMSESSDFIIVEIGGKNYSFHASDVTKNDEEEEEDYEEDEDAERTYEYVIDLDERGDFRAHIEDSDGDVVYEIDGLDDLMSIIEDGFMKNKNDTDGLLQHLIDVGELPKDAVLECKVTEAFRDGQGSHFDSLLKEWAKKYDVQYDMKFKDVRGKKNVPYFTLGLNYEQYIALPEEAKTALNGMMKQFGVDFSYKNRNWTPVIESVEPMNEAKLIKGADLTPEQKKMVLAAYIYRNTKENEKVVRSFLKEKADGMKFTQTDDEWVKDHAFKFSNDGERLTGKYAEPVYLAD